MLEKTQLNQLLTGMVNEKIEELEEYTSKVPQVDLNVRHDYHNGMYTRQITIPKDTIITGAVHKEGYVDIMLSGDITIATSDGLKRFTGYNVMEGLPGRKRAGYAHEDTHWITVHNIAEEDANENYLPNMTFAKMQEYQNYLDTLEYTKMIQLNERLENLLCQQQ